MAGSPRSCSPILHENCTELRKTSSNPPRRLPAGLRDRRHATAKNPPLVPAPPSPRRGLVARRSADPDEAFRNPPSLRPEMSARGSHRKLSARPDHDIVLHRRAELLQPLRYRHPACRAGRLFLLRPAGRHHAFPVRHRHCGGSHSHPPFVSEVGDSQLRQGLAQARRPARRPDAARRERQRPVRLHRACGHGHFRAFAGRAATSRGCPHRRPGRDVPARRTVPIRSRLLPLAQGGAPARPAAHPLRRDCRLDHAAGPRRGVPGAVRRRQSGHRLLVVADRSLRTARSHPVDADNLLAVRACRRLGLFAPAPAALSPPPKGGARFGRRSVTGDSPKGDDDRGHRLRQGRHSSRAGRLQHPVRAADRARRRLSVGRGRHFPTA